MTRLILTEEQQRLLQSAGGRATLVDESGKTLGFAMPMLFTEEEIAEAKRRSASNQRRYTVAEKNAKIAKILAELES